jgi:hypothetical protein
MGCGHFYHDLYEAWTCCAGPVLSTGVQQGCSSPQLAPVQVSRWVRLPAVLILLITCQSNFQFWEDVLLLSVDPLAVPQQ